MLIPSNIAFVHEAMLATFDEDAWDQYGANSDYLASCLALGDNFAMNAQEENAKGVDFYFLICTKTMYTMEKPYKCARVQQFSANGTIVTSRYYQKWGQSKHSYVILKKSQVDVLDICNVRTIKFPLVPTSHRV